MRNTANLAHESRASLPLCAASLPPCLPACHPCLPALPPALPCPATLPPACKVWLRTNGVNTDGAAAKATNFDLRPGTFGKSPSVKKHINCALTPLVPTPFVPFRKVRWLRAMTAALDTGLVSPEVPPGGSAAMDR